MHTLRSLVRMVLVAVVMVSSLVSAAPSASASEPLLPTVQGPIITYTDLVVQTYYFSENSMGADYLLVRVKNQGTVRHASNFKVELHIDQTQQTKTVTGGLNAGAQTDVIFWLTPLQSGLPCNANGFVQLKTLNHLERKTSNYFTIDCPFN